MLPALELLIRLQDRGDARGRSAEADRRRAGRNRRARREADRVARRGRRRQAGRGRQHRRARRTLDKDLLAAQQRLSKYKEQLMEVKTNVEYHAMQHQIEAATAEVAQGRRADPRQHDQGRRGDRAAEGRGSRAEGQRRGDREGARRHSKPTPRPRTRRCKRATPSAAAIVPKLERGQHDMFERVLEGAAGHRRRAGRRRPLLDLPRPPAPAGLQHDPQERSDRAVRSAASASSTSPACTSAPPPARPRLEAAHARQDEHERPTS